MGHEAAYYAKIREELQRKLTLVTIPPNTFWIHHGNSISVTKAIGPTATVYVSRMVFLAPDGSSSAFGVMFRGTETPEELQSIIDSFCIEAHKLLPSSNPTKEVTE